MSDKKWILQRLRDLQVEMETVGLMMEYYGGITAVAEHGKEMYGASRMVKTWIKGMEDE